MNPSASPVASGAPALRSENAVQTGILEAVFSFEADNGVAGVVRKLGSQAQLGSIPWNAGGEASITFSDGTARQVLIF